LSFFLDALLFGDDTEHDPQFIFILVGDQVLQADNGLFPRFPSPCG
jgi:hypothetical protein